MCDCKNGTEAKFRWWFLNELTRRGRWWTRVEAARGGHVGFPDLCVLETFGEGSGLMKPIELKVGDVRRDKLKAGLRPTQINWWMEFEQAGGSGMIVIGLHSCTDGRWQVFWVRGYLAIGASKGLALGPQNGSQDEWRELNMDDV